MKICMDAIALDQRSQTTKENKAEVKAFSSILMIQEAISSQAPKPKAIPPTVAQLLVPSLIHHLYDSW